MNGTAAAVVVAMAALLGVRAPAPASARLAPGTRRSLISSGTRESLTPTITLPTPQPALGRLRFTISPGTTSCGGPGLNPPPAAPFSGRVDDLDGSRRAHIGLGCLYFGAGSATTFPPSPVPDGGTSVLAVTGVSGMALALGPDPGSGPADCTLGAGRARHRRHGGMQRRRPVPGQHVDRGVRPGRQLLLRPARARCGAHREPLSLHHERDRRRRCGNGGCR